MNIDYDGSSTRSFSSTALLAMLLGKVRRNVQATLQRLLGEASAAGLEYSYVLSIGPKTTDQAQQELLDAAYAAGMGQNGTGGGHVQLVETSHCYTYCYQRKFPEALADGRKVVMIDMGHAQTTVAVVGGAAAAVVVEHKDDEPTADGDPEPVVPPARAKVLSAVRHKSLGGGLVDIRLWDHFQSTLPALAKVSKNSRSGQRLLDGSKKLKQLLSQLPEAQVTVENVGEQDMDLTLTATRSLLADLSKDDAQELTELIHSALQEAKVAGSDIFAVEVAGGGCRMPWVKQVLLEAVGNNALSLSYSLDDTSAALGAALVGEDTDTTCSSSAVSSSVVQEQLTEGQRQLRQAEQAMAALDDDMQLRADTMNQIEAHVLEMRSAKHDTNHGSLLPAAELDKYLEEVEDWLFSEQADEATSEQMKAKWDETQQTTQELAKDYFAARANEKAAKDAEMEAEAKQAQAERGDEAAADGGEEEDHDNRRLPKKRRMEIVMKNKQEANELFSDGNYKFAAARYTKALSHCAKFVDLSPDDGEEVKAVKLSLNLNLAFAYLKLENLDQALRVCNDALAIDGENTKALYRRASVYYEKNKWGEANKDIQKAAKIAPEDKAVKKMQERIDAQLKRQKLKEKKMAQKMFK
jgi:heat shock protein 4